MSSSSQAQPSSGIPYTIIAASTVHLLSPPVTTTLPHPSHITNHHAMRLYTYTNVYNESNIERKITCQDYSTCPSGPLRVPVVLFAPLRGQISADLNNNSEEVLRRITSNDLQRVSENFMNRLNAAQRILGDWSERMQERGWSVKEEKDIYHFTTGDHLLSIHLESTISGNNPRTNLIFRLPSAIRVKFPQKRNHTPNTGSSSSQNPCNTTTNTDIPSEAIFVPSIHVSTDGRIIFHTVQEGLTQATAHHIHSDLHDDIQENCIDERGPLLDRFSRFSTRGEAIKRYWEICLKAIQKAANDGCLVETMEFGSDQRHHVSYGFTNGWKPAPISVQENSGLFGEQEGLRVWSWMEDR